VVDLVGDGSALGVTDGVRDGLGVGVGLGREGLGDGVGVGVAVGVADDVGVGVAVGAPEGVADAVGVGVSVGAADDVGAAEVGAADEGAAEVGAADDAGVDELETGAASAGRMTATVEILPAGPDWTLVDTSTLRARTNATVAVPVPGEQARAAPAQAVIAPSTVSVLRPRLPNRPLLTPCGRGAGSLSPDPSGVADGVSDSCWPSPTDIGPPCLDDPDIRCEQYLNR
jgi:hypothetical protein